MIGIAAKPARRLPFQGRDVRTHSMGITVADPLRATRGCSTLIIAESACAGRAMSQQETGYDYDRYKQLLAEAVDETKRLELINQLIREKARDKLEAQRTSDRVAMTAVTVAKVLGSGGRRESL